MNFIDLTSVAAVNALLSQAAGTDAALIQTEITNLSRYILTRTGRSYLGGFLSYKERYDGNGSPMLFLRNYPILAVSSLTINNRSIPQSLDGVQPGWMIDTSGSQANLVMAGGSGSGFDGRYSDSPWTGNGNASPLGFTSYRFTEGRQNIAVSYTAGQVTTQYSESQTVPSVAPYTVNSQFASTFWADEGATSTSGAAIAGYTVAAGVYTLPASLAGQTVLLNYEYGAVPWDLHECATTIVATYYRRPKYLDQTSQMQPGVGTTAYSRAEWAPECLSILGYYTRRFLD